MGGELYEYFGTLCLTYISLNTNNGAEGWKILIFLGGQRSKRGNSIDGYVYP